MAKRRSTIEIARDLEVQRSTVTEVSDLDDPTDDDIARSDAALEAFESLQSEFAEAEAHEERLEAMRSASFAPAAREDARPRGGVEIKRSKDDSPFEILRGNTSGMDENEIARALMDANLKAIEEYEMPKGYDDSFRGFIRRHRKDVEWSKNMLARQRPEYLSAFEKVSTGKGIFLTDIERAAIAVGTNTAGGYLVPTHLDPTLILTNQGAKDVVRGMARVVTLTGGANRWNGVTTAGSTASWDAELTEVSDDTPPIAPVSIPVWAAKSLIQASIESFEDITGLTQDVQMLLADARTRLEAAAHINGSGSGQPTGIFPALAGNGAATLSLTTGRTWTVADINRISNALGDRWTDSAMWLMHPDILGEITALGTALGALYTVDLTQAYPERLRGRAVAQSFTAPNTNQTTTIDQLAVFGDFSNYVIVDKPGSTSIEFIPHLFNTSNNLPDGRRAWYMHFRNGADSVNDLAFRLILDKTTA